MGILKRGDVWYVKWKDATGKWRRKATTARSAADAKLFHAELTRQGTPASPPPSTRTGTS